MRESEISKKRLYYTLSFQMFGRLTSLDGAPVREFNDVLAIFERGVQLEHSTRKHCSQSYLGSIKDTKSIFEYTEEFYLEFAKRPHILVHLIICMLRLSATADGLYGPQDVLIRNIAERFRFPPSAYDRIRGGFVRGELTTQLAQSTDKAGRLRDKSSESAFCVLGCNADSSDGQIRRAYRQLALFYHPDLHASSSLAAEVKGELSARFREIQAAYEKIKNMRTIR